MTKQSSGLPLEGVRVLDFTTILAGPHITQWLGVLGAEIIKIETHSRVESRLVSVIAKTPRRMGLNESDSFAIHNYSKKSVTLNMKHPDALKIAQELVKQCDVITENFAGDTLDRWGLSFAEIQAVRPDAIMYAGSGFGRTGPRAGTPLYAPVADASNGLVMVNGYKGGEPYTLGSSGWTDMAMAMHATFAIMCALRHRQETGQGQYIDCAMVEVQAQFLGDLYMDSIMNGRNATRVGNTSEWRAPHGAYRCRGDDRWVAISVGTQAEWEAFRAAVGDPEWARRAEFADELRRWENQEALDKFITEWTRSQDAHDVARKLQQAGVIATASLDFQELIDDEHIRERGFFRKIDHPVMGELLFAQMPYKMVESTPGDYFHSPLLGEHNGYVFGELLGMPAEEIERLEKEKVLY